MNKNVVLFLLIVIGAVALISCTPAREKTTVKQNKERSKCESLCTNSEYKPVCAADGDSSNTITFGNVCTLKKYNCEHSKNLTVKFESECADKKSPVRIDV